MYCGNRYAITISQNSLKIIKTNNKSIIDFKDHILFYSYNDYTNPIINKFQKIMLALIKYESQILTLCDPLTINKYGKNILYYSDSFNPFILFDILLFVDDVTRHSVLVSIFKTLYPHHQILFIIDV